MKVKVLNTQTQLEVREMRLNDSTFQTNECLLGRSPCSGLILDSPDVSRLHAKFALEQGEYYFYDLGSANGSLVNGKLAHPNQGYLLKPGDIIRVGEFALILYPVGELEELPATVLDNPNATVIEHRSHLSFPGNHSAKVDSQVTKQDIDLPFTGEVPAGEVSTPEPQLHLTEEEEADISSADDAIADENILDLGDEQISVETSDAVLEEEVEVKVVEFQPENATPPVSETLTTEPDQDLDSAISQSEHDSKHSDAVISTSDEPPSTSSSSSEGVSPLANDHTIIQLEEFVELPKFNPDIDISSGADASSEFNRVSDQNAIASIADNVSVGQSLSSMTDILPSETNPPTSDLSSSDADSQIDNGDELLSTTEVDSESIPETEPISPERSEEFKTEIPELESSASMVVETGIQSATQPDDNEADVGFISDEEGDRAEVTNLLQNAPTVQSSSTGLNQVEENQPAEASASGSESALVQPVTENTQSVAGEQAEPDEVEPIVQPDLEVPDAPGDEAELDEGEALDEAEPITQPDSEVLDAPVQPVEKTEETATLKHQVVEMGAEPPASTREANPIAAIATEDASPADRLPADSPPFVFNDKHIALLAHDSQIPALVELVAEHQDFFSHCLTITTPSINEALQQKVGLEASYQTPTVPPGGYQTVNSWMSGQKILAVVFLRDFFNPQAIQANDEAFVRSCHVRQVLFAGNLPTAGALIQYLQSKAFVTK
jgi:methylglyoxal synthase/pSer/pThr/pTyr-binding forkhead associated (FHA) protein